MTQIDGPPPSVSPACQMAGGLQSPDIHQCLAVTYSHSSALTLGPVQQTSLYCLSMRAWSNDATKWGAITWEQMEILANMAQLSHAAVQLCPPSCCGPCISWTGKNVWPNADILNPVSKYFQGFHKRRWAITLCAIGCLLALVATPIPNIFIMGTHRCKMQQNATASLWPGYCVQWHGISCSSTTTSVHECSSKSETQSSRWVIFSDSLGW